MSIGLGICRVALAHLVKVRAIPLNCEMSSHIQLLNSSIVDKSLQLKIAFLTMRQLYSYPPPEEPDEQNVVEATRLCVHHKLNKRHTGKHRQRITTARRQPSFAHHISVCQLRI